MLPALTLQSLVAERKSRRREWGGVGEIEMFKVLRTHGREA